MNEAKHAPGPYLRKGAFVYALNSGGTNRFDALVQAGSDDDGARTSSEELEATAALFQAAPKLAQLLSAYVALCGNTGGHFVAREDWQRMYEEARAVLDESQGNPTPA